MVKFICNAFSFNMVSLRPFSVNVRPVPLHTAIALAQGVPSAVGHCSTAAVFQTTLGTPVAEARVNVALVPGDSVLVGQYQGPRLPEGATTLPEGATIAWLLVDITESIADMVGIA